MEGFEISDNTFPFIFMDSLFDFSSEALRIVGTIREVSFIHIFTGHIFLGITVGSSHRLADEGHGSSDERSGANAVLVRFQNVHDLLCQRHNALRNRRTYNQRDAGVGFGDCMR